MISFGTFLLGLLTMLGSYIIQPLIAMAGFALMAVSGYVFVRNTKALLKAENDNNKTYGQILKDVRSADTNTKGT